MRNILAIAMGQYGAMGRAARPGELRERGVFRFGNPTSGGTVFLHVQKLFPRFPLLMNFVSHCVSLASTC
jgi:hypothetical protein